MATEQFTIPRRPSWELMSAITVSIECDPLAPQPIKLGLAVRAAFSSRATLSGANLYGADLSRANLSGATLSGANLSGANLSGATLSGANLYGANLYGANLSGANLSGANLSGANLSRANLSGANLYGANLSRADLTGAKVRDEPVKRLFASVSRINDPYVFHAFELEAGGVKILAGCRWFTVGEYAAHVADEYPDEPKGVETLNILDFIQERAKALEIPLTAPAETEAA